MASPALSQSPSAPFCLKSSATAQPVQLITDKEAKLPAAPEAASRAITRGPGVKLLSSESVANGVFPLKVVFEPRGGSKIDPGSVQVIYLKKPTVDLTSRIKSAIRPDGIDLASATAPESTSYRLSAISRFNVFNGSPGKVESL